MPSKSVVCLPLEPLPSGSVTFSIVTAVPAACGRESIDHKTSMIKYKVPLRGLLFYQDLGFSHALPFLKKGQWGSGYESPDSGYG